MENFGDIFSRICIVADDLTSAADGASPFLARGHRPRIHRRTLADVETAILSVDTGSRSMSATDAAEATRAAVSAFAGDRTLYKTMDSTLRGHIRAEILAAFHASGRQRLVIAPAFPAAGRTTIDAIQWLDGRPVADTFYAQDPAHPTRTSNIRDLVDPSLGTPGLVTIEMGDAEVRTVASSNRVVIVDADSQEKLNDRVARLAQMGPALWVGSPGMAQALAKLTAPATAGAPATPALSVRRVLAVVGSANRVSREQTPALRAAGAAISTRASDISSETQIACLSAPASRQSDARNVLSTLVDEACAALQQQRFDAVIATGGETMDALLQRLTVKSFALIGELEPGFPMGYATRETGQSLAIALKAGGFGTPTTLLNAARHLVST
ncbi:four-carbon acid sugar kinase family protein [Ensifer sp. HO-A22]|uniref:Four-carbon acid sugar kinase family protein n=1 Tax=Ensifer oleiphilus TaxID=2742698 RepID=A0A7Y6QAM2_9HYPH|nr:four-carbon acid sugar kinase family protein [Ensifer oleiphilus]NVD42097.1 four-carbon acid sugar kinase family protein [Ensifer oleiphilus]